MSEDSDRYENCIYTMKVRLFGDDYVIIESDDTKGIRVSVVNINKGPLTEARIGLENVIKTQLRLVV